MKTDEIFRQIYKDLKEEMNKKTDDIFLKEYTIPSINYSPDSDYLASGIEMELEQMMSYFGYKIYYSRYKEKYFFSNSNEMAQGKMLAEIETETKAELKRKLEEKIDSEYDNLVEELKKSKPQVIIERAYELVVKEQMMYRIGCREYEVDELQALLNTKGILQSCYDGWLSNDGGLDEVLEYTVSEEIDLIIKEYHEEKEKIKDLKESR